MKRNPALTEKTLEDFTAHSNWVELVLLELGHQVFPQVGLSTQITLRNRQVFPLTTGTFGGLDFVHSLLGEATDKLSQTQISEVSDGLLPNASESSSGLLSTLANLIATVPGSGDLNRELSDMQTIAREADDMRAQESYSLQTQMSFDADEIARKIYPVFAFRDKVVKRHVFSMYFFSHRQVF